MSKKVSIIIPCRNEEKFIQKVIKSIVNQVYPKDKLEVFFIDGLSEDRTVKIIKKYSKKYPFIKLLVNPHKHVSQAMNLGIKNATGDIIIRMDAHSEYPKNYIKDLVYWLEKLNADNVGGICTTTPSDNTLKAQAICFSLSHFFGVGNSLFRIVKNLKVPIEVDTVPFGCYRKDIFDRIGLYDERLTRNQDIELNKRLKNSGGKIYLVPNIKVKYYARNSWKKLWKNSFENGRWVILTAALTKDFSSLSLRHFVPLFFILYLVAVPLTIKFSIVSLLPLLFYSLILISVSFNIALKNNKLSLFPYLCMSFIILHISYGLGSFKALIGIIMICPAPLGEQDKARR